MSVWSVLSVAALVAASVPPLYFALRMRDSNPRFARLSGLLAAALLVHAVYHSAETVLGPGASVVGLEAVSAALILVFGLAYWPLRRKG